MLLKISTTFFIIYIFLSLLTGPQEILRLPDRLRRPCEILSLICQYICVFLYAYIIIWRTIL